MTLSYIDTIELFELVLTEPKLDARMTLNARLTDMGRSESEFCMGVIEHGRAMGYTSEQWSDFLSRVPNKLFRDEHWLMNRLSEKQRQMLGY